MSTRQPREFVESRATEPMTASVQILVCSLPPPAMARAIALLSGAVPPPCHDGARL